MEFGTDLHSPQRVKHKNFGDPFTFTLPLYHVCVLLRNATTTALIAMNFYPDICSQGTTKAGDSSAPNYYDTKGN